MALLKEALLLIVALLSERTVVFVPDEKVLNTVFFLDQFLN